MMKKITLSLFLLCSSIILQGQRLDRPPINGEWERDRDGNRELVYTNHDYCDYYILRSTGGTATRVRPDGRTVGIRMSRNTSTFNSNLTPGSFSPFKGYFLDKFNPDFLYALPGKVNDTLYCLIDEDERQLTFRFRVKPSDTIYAVRSGVVCLDDDYGMIKSRKHTGKSLLIYHRDNTFAEYSQIAATLVAPGEEVLTGQPIAIASSVTERSYKSFRLAVFFLDKNKFEEGGSRGSRYTHISPVFHTSQGNLKLKDGNKYLPPLVPDSIITQDMSKRAKKKYEKRKVKK